MSAPLQMLACNASPMPRGQALLTASSGNWVCPSGVFSVSVLQVGMGGGPSANRGGCGGGGTIYTTSITVTPGTSYPYSINSSGSTIFGRTAGAGQASGNANGAGTLANSGAYTAGFLGGNGGNGSDGFPNGGGGGGAGGYSAAGGAGGNQQVTGSSSSGGGGGGGAGAGGVSGYKGSLGGGVGMLGAGSNGGGGTPANGDATGPGTAGSGGSGVTYGGGCGGNAGSQTPGAGAIRIIWGVGRSYPSTNTADV